MRFLSFLIWSVSGSSCSGLSDDQLAEMIEKLTALRPNLTIKASQSNREYAMSYWRKDNPGYLEMQALFGLRAPKSGKQRKTDPAIDSRETQRRCPSLCNAEWFKSNRRTVTMKKYLKLMRPLHQEFFWSFCRSSLADSFPEANYASARSSGFLAFCLLFRGVYLQRHSG